LFQILFMDTLYINNVVLPFNLLRIFQNSHSDIYVYLDFDFTKIIFS